jgi:hypothetical protein
MSIFNDIEAWLEGIFFPKPAPKPPVKAPPVKPKPKGGVSALSAFSARQGAPSPTGAPKAAKGKWGAPKYAKIGEGQKDIAPADLPMVNLAIQKCLENARNAESNYDKLKNSEGWGTILEIGDALSQFAAVYDNPVAIKDIHGVGVQVADMPEIKPPTNTGDIGRWHRDAKAAYYRAHEKSVKLALSFTGKAHTVTKSEHRGEDYVWNHVLIIGPGIFDSA